MNIVLIGYRGSGKTATGRILAERLGWGFLDTDAIIEKRSSLTIRDIYADQAEDGFRDMESRVITECADRDWHVISTGGGAVLRPENAEALKRNGTLVWLAAPADILWERITSDEKRRTSRPELDVAAGLEEVRSSLREREPVYAGWAEFVLDTGDLAPEATADEILHRLGLPRRDRAPAVSGT